MPVIYLFALVALLVGLVSRRKPALEQDWKPEVAKQTRGRIEGDTLTLSAVRNTRYGDPGTAFSVVWEERSYDLSKLKRLWFIVESFSNVQAVAHTFLSFEFSDGQFLAVSVEARPERDEQYGIVDGLLRQFELVYLFGDERDFVARRTLYQEHEVYLYPLVTPPDEVRKLLEDMVETANALTVTPRFYNSITDNCTSVLRQHANRVRPGSFSAFARAQVLPGTSDVMLYKKGWLKTDVLLDSLRETHAVKEKTQHCPLDAEFSHCIRE